ncbi:MAG: phosphate transport system protein [Lentimonas sp.]|jgi:phosphate transport system protein
MKLFYQHELENLRTKLILIGEKANEAARIAVDGLLENDLGKIDQALALDDAIDALEVEIDQASVRYITLRSPVSSDVRSILVAIKASHDLERAGDEAHSIALRAKEILTSDGRSGDTVAIGQMSLLSCSMMADAISALVEGDVELARAVILRDKKVNELHQQNFEKLTICAPDGSTQTTNCFQKVFISKSIERIADHAKNLAEEVIYLLEGPK